MYGIHPYAPAGKAAKKLSTRFYLQLRFLVNSLHKNLKIIRYLKKHKRLVEILKPFSGHSIIKSTTITYAFLYLSKSLSTKKKLDILTYHYRYLLEILPINNLDVLFKDGIPCWSETINGDKLSINLVHSLYLEFEGSLSLFFTVNGTCIYKLSFTIAPGIHFGFSDEKIIYISLLQGTIGETDSIARATRILNDLIPSTILLSVIEGIGLSLGIKKIIGINFKNQLCYNKKLAATHYNNYNAYWNSQGGMVMANRDYLFSCPIQLKPISSIKAKYRNRTIAKRAKRVEITEKIFHRIFFFYKERV